jgi:predicted secreted protein
MAINTQGCALAVGDGASPEAFTDVAGVVSLQGPSGSRSVIDITTLASTGREKDVGIPDYGNVTAELIYDGDSASNTSLWDDFQNGTLRNFQLKFDDSPQEVFSFSAYVLSYSYSAGIDDVVRASLTMEVSGSITDNN